MAANVIIDKLADTIRELFVISPSTVGANHRRHQSVSVPNAANSNSSSILEESKERQNDREKGRMTIV